MNYSFSEWNGYRRADFLFEGREAIVLFPKCEPNGRWMIKMEYFAAFQEFEFYMLDRGWHLTYLKNINRWGTDADSDAKARFADFVSQEFGLYKKTVCVGMSCGGLCSVNFAARHPEYVSFLYLDAPVMNLLSCPMGFGVGDPLGNEGSGWSEIVDAYGFDLPTLLTYREHPIDKISTLAENHLPVALIYGDSDKVVPYIENGVVLERYYKEHGLPLFTEAKVGVGHHPHGPTNVSALSDFIEKNML